jgi:hypothetical protein
MMMDHPLILTLSKTLAMSPEAAGKPPTLAMLLLGFGVMLAIFLLMRHQWRRSASRRAGAMQSPTERIDAIRAEASSASPLHSSMAEATELAQRLAAQLDNKAERLDQLLAEAEQAIARLEQLQKGAPPRLGAGDEQDRPDAPESESDVDPATRQIYQLADQGHDPVEIARRLDQHLGKVQLILALRRA